MAFRFSLSAFIVACATSTTDVPMSTIEFDRFSITMQIFKSESTSVATNDILDVIHDSIEQDVVLSVVSDEDNIFIVDITFFSSDELEDEGMLIKKIDTELTGNHI